MWSILGQQNGDIDFLLNKVLLPLLFIPSLVVLTLPSTAQEENDDLGKRYIQSAQVFFQRGDYEQALKDWNYVIDNLPKSRYADEALVELGRYYFEVRRDPTKARNYFDKVISQYPQADKVPAAHYFLGEILLADGTGSGSMDEALATFERIAVLYPLSPWAGRASIQAGLIYWLRGDTLKSRAACRTALHHVQDPDLVAEGWFCIARAFAREESWDSAIDALLRLQSLGNPRLSSHAMDGATALYRHILRSSTNVTSYFNDPNFHFAGDIRLDEPRWLVTMPEGFAVVDKGLKWLVVYDKDGKFKEKKVYSRIDYAARSWQGDLVIVSDDMPVFPDLGRKVLRISDYSGKTQEIKVETLAVDNAGRLWVQSKGPGLMLFTVRPSGEVLSVETPFQKTAIEYQRVQIDPWQRLWLIGKKGGSVFSFFRDGKSALALQTGTWRPQKPVAVGLDILGFIYVLDQRSKEMIIFTPAGRLLKIIDLRLLFHDLSPLDMVVASDGSIYLLEKNSRTVYHLI